MCTIIGAGFATGKELLTYFTAYGTIGFVGIFISAILFSVIIHKIMLCPCNTLEELLEPYFFGKILYIIINIFLVVLYSAMLSASGEVLNQIFGISNIIGIVISAFLTSIVIVKGYERVADLSQVLFVPIVVIIFVISLMTTEKNIAVAPATIVTTKAVLSPFIYVSYNMLTAIPLLICIPNKYMYKSCSYQIGSVIFMLSVLIMLPLYTHYSSIAGSSLPIMELLSGNIKYLYLLLLLIAIFSTSVSSAYSFIHSLREFKTLIAVVVTNILAILLSLVGFSNIVGKVYCIFGVAGGVLMWVVLKGVREK